MYTTHRDRRQDEKEAQARLVSDICKNMRPVRASNTRTVWNDCLQRYVEVR